MMYPPALDPVLPGEGGVCQPHVEEGREHEGEESHRAGTHLVRAG